MSRRRETFRGDERAVSEVIGYILSFLIAFLILVLSMATFQVVSKAGDRQAAGAEFVDIANRVAASVLDAFEIGERFRETSGSIDSGIGDAMVYERALDVPGDFRGFAYRVEIDSRYVYVNSTDGSILANSTTFKADVVLPGPADTCDATYIVCEIEALNGGIDSEAGRVIVAYEYDPEPPFTNRIQLR